MNVGGYYWMMFRVQRLMQLARFHAQDGSSSPGPDPIVVHAPSGHPASTVEFQTIIVGVAIGMAIFIALTLAAVWRRLHDCGRTGAWGVLPVLFASVSFAGMFHLMGDVPARGSVSAVFPLVFLSNLAYFGSALALVVMLAIPGMPGANRFGPDPKTAEAE